jgi:hypothetical protein
MYNLQQEIDTFRESIGRPTHILVTKEQSEQIFPNFNASDILTRYGLILVFTTVDLENPRLLKFGL